MHENLFLGNKIKNFRIVNHTEIAERSFALNLFELIISTHNPHFKR